MGGYRTELVVIAAGPWSVALGRTAGVELPIVPVLHEYFVTEPLPGWHAGLPCLRIPEVQVYARGESDRALCGGFENQGTSLTPLGVEVGSALPAPPNWDVLGGFAASLSDFAPALAMRASTATFRGWPTFSPDGRFIVARYARCAASRSQRDATHTECPGRPGWRCTWSRVCAAIRLRTCGR